MSDIPPAVTDAHIKRFQDRARFHFWIGYALLLGIVGLFAFAVYIFTFAQEIDRRKGSVQVLQQIHIAKAAQDAVVEAAQREYDLLNQSFQNGLTPYTKLSGSIISLAQAKTQAKLLTKQESLMLDIGYVPDLDTPRSKEELSIIADGKKEIENEIQRYGNLVRERVALGTAGASDLAEVERLLSEATKDREIAEQRAQGASPAAQLRTTAAALDTIELVRTSLIRFGGVAVTLFLISLLTPIYRYNVRLGTYYLARADALTLCRDTHVSDFAEMIRLLTPLYTFDKEPTTPVESIASLARDASGLVRRGT
jgi:hypothetical protein